LGDDLVEKNFEGFEMAGGILGASAPGIEPVAGEQITRGSAHSLGRLRLQTLGDAK
jgi:hypothetical protein